MSDGATTALTVWDGRRPRTPVIGEVWLERRAAGEQAETSSAERALLLVEARSGTRVELSTLARGQTVGWGDGKTCHLLYTELTVDDFAARAGAAPLTTLGKGA